MSTIFLTRPSEANDASFSDFFIFHFLATFGIRKSPFFSDFDESITDRPTDQQTDGRTRPLIEMRYWMLNYILIILGTFQIILHP